MFEDWYLNELFSKTIKNVWKYTDYYLLKLIFNILEETEIINLLKKEISIEEVIQIKKYSPKVIPALKWMLDRLALDNYISNNTIKNNTKYKLTDKKMDYNLSEIKKKAVEMAPDSESAFDMLQIIADEYPKYLSGDKKGIDIVYSPKNLNITFEYYCNNLFYNVHNIAGAKILNWDIDNRQNPEIIEIGCGLGGGTKQFILQRLNEHKNIPNFHYYVSDIANKMLRETKKSLLKITNKINQFNFNKIDFNKTFKSQGFENNSIDIIWGVNAIHVAIDLRFTLNEIYKTLKPGGSIILSETVRPIGNSMIQQELLLNTIDDYWNVNIDKEIRPRHGFMDWSDWVNALKNIGFSNVQTIPDMKILQEKYDNCYAAVIRGIKK